MTVAVELTDGQVCRVVREASAEMARRELLSGLSGLSMLACCAAPGGRDVLGGDVACGAGVCGVSCGWWGAGGDGCRRRAGCAFAEPLAARGVCRRAV